MHAPLGWALAVLAHGLGWVQYGWPGLAMAFSVTVFWLLLQFSRSLRVMRRAAAAPLGSVGSAVMLHSRLRTGMRLLDLVTQTGSLGRRLEGPLERYAWGDAGGDEVWVTMKNGRCEAWELQRRADSR